MDDILFNDYKDEIYRQVISKQINESVSRRYERLGNIVLNAIRECEELGWDMKLSCELPKSHPVLHRQYVIGGDVVKIKHHCLVVQYLSVTLSNGITVSFVENDGVAILTNCNKQLKVFYNES